MNLQQTVASRCMGRAGDKSFSHPHRETYGSRIRRWIVRHFQISIVSAVKICKQCVQTVSAPLPGLRLWTPLSLGYSAQMKSPGAALATKWQQNCVAFLMCVLPRSRVLYMRRIGRRIIFCQDRLSFVEDVIWHFGVLFRFTVYVLRQTQRPGVSGTTDRLSRCWQIRCLPVRHALGL